jgi:hypothetical protein
MHGPDCRSTLVESHQLLAAAKRKFLVSPLLDQLR